MFRDDLLFPDNYTKITNNKNLALVKKHRKFLYELCVNNFQNYEITTIKKDKDKTTQLISANNTNFIIKTYFFRGLFSILAHLLLKSRLLRIHNRICTIKQFGIHIPEIEASIFLHRGPLHWEYFSIFEYLTHSVTLNELLRSEISLSKKQDMIDKVVEQIILLHRIPVIHGDMKLNNIMIHNDRPFLIDLDGFGKLYTRKKTVDDIARFLVGLMEVGISDNEIRRVLNQYATAMNLSLTLLHRQTKRIGDKIIKRHKIKYNIELNDIPDL